MSAGSSEVVARRIKNEIQDKVQEAGLEILKHESPTWRMHKKLPLSCFSGNKQVPCRCS